MRSEWFAIIRSGILEHLTHGKLGFEELGIYTTIHLQANFSTGIWWGSAPKLLAAAPRGTSLRKVQRGLENLGEIQFIRSFQKHGARGNYPVLIDKYDVKVGALKGKRLNARYSSSWERPLYECCAESDAENAPIQEVISQEIRKFSPIVATSSIQSSLPNRSEDQNRAREFPGFLIFYEQYPQHRRGVEEEVLFEWAKIPFAEQHLGGIVIGLERWKSSAQWTEANGRFVPKASKFLAEKLWSVNPKGGLSRAEERTLNNLRAAGFAG